MIKADRYYIDNLNELLTNGCSDEHEDYPVRPRYKDGTPSYTRFITQIAEKYNIQQNEFPITTLRNTATKTGIKEILWIYQTQSNTLKSAHDIGVNWWDNWDVGDGTIGQRYGATVAKYNLINELLDGLEKNPFGRRHIMDMYQYEDMRSTPGLHPCAFMTLWSVRCVNDTMFIDLTLTQRSNDYIMASYINKIQYVALAMMVAGHLNTKTDKKWEVGNFMHIIQNLHIYDRHIDAAKEILSREPLDQQPILKINSNKNFYEYTIDDFTIENVKGIKKLDFDLEIAI